MARINIYYINIINGDKSYQLSLKHLNKSRTYKSMTSSVQHYSLRIKEFWNNILYMINMLSALS